MHRFLVIVAVCSTIATLSAHSQSASSQNENATKPLTWDAVSIKPHRALDDTAMTRILPNGYEMQNMTIQPLVFQAFPIRSGDQIEGWPGWTNSERFDVLAKMDADTADTYHKLRGDESGNTWRQMIRELLEDRFALKYHIEKRVLPVYELAVAKHGQKMKMSPPGEPASSAMSTTMSLGKLTAHQSTVSSLVGMLSGIVGRMVIDKTGLTGVYDVDLTWKWNDEPGSTETGPSIFTALQEQLGLKLEPAKAPVDVVVIEHIERPSEN